MERERQEKRREKLERLRHEPKHFFVDPSYDKQKQEVTENLSDAITQGVRRLKIWISVDAAIFPAAFSAILFPSHQYTLP